MISFVSSEIAKKVLDEKRHDSIAIPVAVDTVTTCDMYKYICQLYPEFDKTYTDFAGNRDMRPGYSISFVMDDGVMIFLLFVKVIDAYQANLNDIQRALSTTLFRMRQFKKKHLILHNMSTENTKLSNQLLIPSITYEAMLFEDIQVDFINSYKDEVISDYSEKGILLKKNEWKSSWLLMDDDLLIAAIISDLNYIAGGIKLSKSRMLVLFKVCHEEGLYQKYQFVKGPYGWYFKEFMMKLSALINHGILIDAEHFSTSKRTDYRIGPSYYVLSELAKDELFNQRVRIRKIAMAIKTKFAEIKKETYEKQQEKGDTSFKRF